MAVIRVERDPDTGLRDEIEALQDEGFLKGAQNSARALNAIDNAGIRNQDGKFIPPPGARQGRPQAARLLAASPLLGEEGRRGDGLKYR